MALVQKSKLSLLGLIFGLCLGLFLRTFYVLNQHQKCPPSIPGSLGRDGLKSEYSYHLLKLVQSDRRSSPPLLSWINGSAGEEKKENISQTRCFSLS